MSEQAVSVGPCGSDADLSIVRGTAAASPAISAGLPILAASVILVAAMLLSVAGGPVHISFGDVVRVLLARIPLLHLHSHTSALDQTIVWELRVPRVVLAGLVGSMLAAGGTAYQGVFRNPLADPYLLGVAAGAGLGASMVIVSGQSTSLVLPLAAFLGGIAAVGLTWTGWACGSKRRTPFAA